MVIENISLNSSELFSGLLDSLTPVLTPLITIFKAVGIAILIYVVFLIIRAFLNLKATLRIRKISQNVEEINSKLDLIVHKLISKKSDEREIKKNKKIKKKK